MKLFGFFISKWVIIRIAFYIILIVLNGLFDFFNLTGKVGVKVNLLLFLILVVLEVIRVVDDDTNKHRIDSKLTKVDKNTEETKEVVLEIDKKIEEGKLKRNSKYEGKKVKLLVELINHQLISKKTVKEIITEMDKKFISVLIYADSLKSSEKFKENHKNKRREYIKIFENLGFTRLGYPSSKGYFLIAEQNLYPEKLRNLDNLSAYLVDKLKVSFGEEWAYVLDFSKKESRRFYNINKEKRIEMNATILISIVGTNDMRFDFIYKSGFDKSFSKELLSVTKKNKLKISDLDKLQVKRFITNSSLNILILELTEREKKTLLELEPKFKEELKIKNFYDYHRRNVQDITNIISKRIKDKNKARELAKRIQKNSKKYEEDLVELGVNLE